MSSTKRIDVELSDPLIDGHGFRINSEKFEEMFEQENMTKDKHTGQSKSNEFLVEGLGGVDQVVASLKSDPKMGIDNNKRELAARADKYGSNSRIKREIQTIGDMICGVFEDFIILVLCAAAVVSTIIGLMTEGWPIGAIEGLSIIIAIVIITVVTVSQDYAKEKQFQKVMEADDIKSAVVIRNGELITLDTEDLVVGDIVNISTGDQVPADCIILESYNVSCSESQLTGEPHAKRKEPITAENFSSAPCPFLYQGSLIETGNCKAIIAAVGNRTAQGKAGLTMNMEADQTPLQKKLDSIANTIGLLGTYVAILTFIAVIIRTLCIVFIKGDRAFLDEQNLEDVLQGFIIAVTIIVVAVPEGLPLAVAIALYVASTQMEKENNAVRRLKASETMGNANEICTDKTGTLTENRMTVMEAYYLDQIAVGTQNNSLPSISVGDLVRDSICYNSSVFIETLETGAKKAQGNVTEVGIVKYLQKSGCEVEQHLKDRDQNLETLFTIPFSSLRKSSTNVIRHPQQAGMIRVFCKGAPDMVMKKCDKIILDDGVPVELTDDKRDDILKTRVIKNFADKCLRTILIAYADYTEAEWENFKEQNGGFETPEQQEAVEQGLTIIGIFALQDPLRPGIADTVDIMHRAGINIRMVTGDFMDTAIAISKEAHIIRDSDRLEPEYREEYACMTGETFRNKIMGSVKVEGGEVKVDIANMKAFKDIYPSLKVLARSSPNDKFMLVHGLIDCGKTVAVTGDGTNDAPALNRADVGISMGITGTEVAKNASDIKLLDDNFCSIKTAVRYGRNIYDNVKKFLQFQLTVNVVAMFIVFVGSMVFEETPLNAVQMLWVNLIMDTLASLALATEPPSENIMERQPSSKQDKIVDSVMWRNIFGHGIYQIIVLMLLLVWGRDWFNLPYDNSDPLYADQAWLNSIQDTDPAKFAMYSLNEATNKCTIYTLVFQTFVMMQIFNMINARKLKNDEYNVFASFFNNLRFVFILVLILAIQIALVYFGGRAFKTVPLNQTQQIVAISAGAFTLIWAVVIKLIIPPRIFDWLSIDEKELDDKESLDTIQSQVRRSYRHSRTFRESKPRVDTDMTEDK